MRLLTVLPLLGLTLTTPAYASEVAPQAIFKVKGAVEAGPKWDIGTFWSVFVAPGSSPIYFAYLGPGYQATPGWWTSIRPGVVIGLPTADDALPVISWWNYLESGSGRLSLFVETDLYPSFEDGTVIYFGVYSLDYRLSKAVGAGVHGEQVNDHLTVGPHVNLLLSEHLATGLEYHWAGPGSDHILRATLGLSL